MAKKTYKQLISALNVIPREHLERYLNLCELVVEECGLSLGKKVKFTFGSEGKRKVDGKVIKNKETNKFFDWQLPLSIGNTYTISIDSFKSTNPLDNKSGNIHIVLSENIDDNILGNYEILAKGSYELADFYILKANIAFYDDEILIKAIVDTISDCTCNATRPSRGGENVDENTLWNSIVIPNERKKFLATIYGI